MNTRVTVAVDDKSEDHVVCTRHLYELRDTVIGYGLDPIDVVILGDDTDAACTMAGGTPCADHNVRNN